VEVSSNDANLAHVKSVNGFPASEVRCLALAIYFEAGNEPREAQIGVGQTALNRARAAKTPRAICKTVYNGLAQGGACLFEATCRNLGTPAQRGEALERAIEVASGLASGTAIVPLFTQATHFHEKRARPAWARGLFKLASHGRIEFYSTDQPTDTVAPAAVTDEAEPVVQRRPAVARSDASAAKQASQRRDDGGALARQVFGID
jgi:spore germination cell wall hydrolase CwlJ-like protein